MTATEVEREKKVIVLATLVSCATVIHMAGQRKGAKNPIMAAFVANWIEQQKQGGKSIKSLAREWGRSHTALLKVVNGSGGVASDTEAWLAERLTDGSVDRLREQAKEYWAAHPEVWERYQDKAEPWDDDPIPERGRAIVAARIAEYSDVAIQRVRAMKPRREGMSIQEWLETIADVDKLIKQGMKLG